MDTKFDLAKSVLGLLRQARPLVDASRYKKIEWQGREPKIPLDTQLDSLIREGLAHTGIPVLSEESDKRPEWFDAGPVWIVDPLDGSLNFARNSGPSAISIALWNGEKPSFGAIMDIASGEIAWGANGVALRSERPLHRSTVDDKHQAILCTGIPSGFDWACADAWAQRLSAYGKIRMIGSAASSLLMVAEGKADAYFESGIKIWDVAAGIALVEAAGGKWAMSRRSTIEVDLSATNGHLGE